MLADYNQRASYTAKFPILEQTALVSTDITTTKLKGQTTRDIKCLFP